MAPRARIEVGWLIVILAIGILPVAAQSEGETPWQLTGAAGFTLFRNTNTPVSTTNTETDVNQSLAFDYRALLQGFIKDPRILTFNANFEGEQALNAINTSNNINNQDFNTNLLNFGVNALLFSPTQFPARVWFDRGNADSAGGVFNNSSVREQYGFEWNLNRPNVPHLLARYVHDQDDVQLAQSISQTSFKQNGLVFEANDVTKGWNWNAGYNMGLNSTASLGTLEVDTDQNFRILNLRATRKLFGDAGLLNLESRTESFTYKQDGSNNTNSSDTLNNINLDYRVSSRLTTTAYFTFYHASANGNLSNIIGTTPAVTISDYATTNESLGGIVDYRWLTWLTIFENPSYNHFSPTFDASIEALSSDLENRAGLTATGTWRHIQGSATYTGQFDYVTTTFHNNLTAFSNLIQGQAAWGTPRNVRISGNADYTRLNTVEQVGGYSHLQHLYGQVETHRLPVFWLTASGGYYNTQLLSFSGLINSGLTEWSAQLENRKVTLTAGQFFTTGSGAILPGNPGFHQISDPIPIAELAATPLLDHTGKVFAAGASFRLKRNLDLMANYQRESDLLSSSTQNYKLLEVTSKYVLGKLTFEFGYGHYFNQNFTYTVAQPSVENGLTASRIYFRVLRDFRIF